MDQQQYVVLFYRFDYEYVLLPSVAFVVNEMLKDAIDSGRPCPA